MLKASLVLVMKYLWCLERKKANWMAYLQSKNDEPNKLNSGNILFFYNSKQNSCPLFVNWDLYFESCPVFMNLSSQ